MTNPFPHRLTEAALAPAARARRYLLIFLSAALPTLGALVWLYAYDRREAIVTLEKRDHEHLVFQRTIMENNFREAVLHLSELAADARITRFLANPSDATSRARAADALLALCRYRNCYRRITLLGTSGEILLRAWDLAGTPPFMEEGATLKESVAASLREALRLRGDEALVQDALLEPPPGTGSGPLNVIRIGRLLRDGRGATTGVLFMNYDFEDLTRDVESVLPVSGSGFSIVREDGLILNLDPDPDEPPAGRVRGPAPVRRFDLLYPNAWLTTKKSDYGQTRNREEGIFTYLHYYPFQSLPLTGNDALFESQRFLKGIRSSHHWVLVSRINRRMFDRAIWPLRQRYLVIGALALALLAGLCALLGNYLHRRLESEFELKRTLGLLDHELELSRSALDSLMPRDFHDLPELDADRAYIPSSRVGGDFYDLFRLDGRRVAFFLFDMSGHGVPAALGTLLVRAALARLIRETGSPSATLSAANAEFQDQLGEDQFLTAFVGVLDLATGALAFASAGAPPPLLLRAGSPPEPLVAEGSLLGVLPEVAFNEERRTLAPGDTVILYTDGFIEARDDQRRFYSAERLSGVLANAPAGDARTLKNRLVADLAAFTGADRYADDVTLLVIRLRSLTAPPPAA